VLTRFVRKFQSWKNLTNRSELRSHARMSAHPENKSQRPNDGGLLTLECRLALLNLFLASLGEAGFVRGFSQIVEFALVQPHGPVTKGTRDGGETFFHAARRRESWRFQTIRAFGACCKRCLANVASLATRDQQKMARSEGTAGHRRVQTVLPIARAYPKVTRRPNRRRCPWAICHFRKTSACSMCAPAPNGTLSDAGDSDVRPITFRRDRKQVPSPDDHACIKNRKPIKMRWQRLQTLERIGGRDPEAFN